LYLSLPLSRTHRYLHSFPTRTLFRSMKTVVERARAIGAVPTVITFEPHPRAVLHRASAPPLLQTFDQKIEALSVLGIEQTIIIQDRKSTRLNSSHVASSYAGLCLKKQRRIARAKDRATFVRQTACDAALVGRR